MCEIARNSVLQSGFEHPFKCQWIGSSYGRPGPDGNGTRCAPHTHASRLSPRGRADIYMTNVPNVRLQFRHELLSAERQFIGLAAAGRPGATPTSRVPASPAVQLPHSARGGPSAETVAMLAALTIGTPEEGDHRHAARSSPRQRQFWEAVTLPPPAACAPSGAVERSLSHPPRPPRTQGE